MTEHVIAKLQEYKVEMDYQNIDFSMRKDIVTMYSKLLTDKKSPPERKRNWTGLNPDHPKST